MERLHKLGHGLVPWSRTADPGLVQHQHKEVNALTVDNAGIAQFQTSPMQNINIMPGISQLVKLIFQFEVSPHQGNLVPGAQAPSLKHKRILSCLCSKCQAPSSKLQAPSCKLQAASSKLQAPSLKNIIESNLNSFPILSNREDCIVALGPEIMDLGSWNKF